MTDQPQGFVCDVCNQVFADKRGLGTHRRFKHGIKGAKSEINRRYEERRKLKQLGHPPAVGADEKQQTQVTRTPSSNKEPDDHESSAGPYSSSPTIPLELVAYAVGKIEALAERIALENEIPGKVFARWCAEYFSKSARR